MDVTPLPFPLPRAHARRLREMYRSAGWPCLDAIEVDLLAAGLLARVSARDADGTPRDSLHVTDAGLAALAVALQRNRAAFDAHEALVALVVRQMQRGGRTAFTRLSLRAAVPGTEGEGPRWVLAKPGAYMAMGSECWYVLGRDARAREIGDASEVPAEFGVMQAVPVLGNEPQADRRWRLVVQRQAPRRALPDAAGLPFAAWLALARAVPAAPEEETQARL